MNKIWQSDEIEVWQGQTEGGTEQRSRLTPEELERAARYLDPVLRDRFISRRSALRTLLDSSESFELGPYKKPFLPGGPQFSVSRSGDHFLIALSNRFELGVDSEVSQSNFDFSPLLNDHFRPDERLLKRLYPRMWVRKEACAKALGVGLSQDLVHYPVGVETADRLVVLPNLLVSDLPIQGDFVAAIAWITE